MIIAELDRQVTYAGVEYEVVNALDNDLLLVVRKDDLTDGKFPLQTYIVPESK